MTAVQETASLAAKADAADAARLPPPALFIGGEWVEPEDFAGQIHAYARQFCPPNRAAKAVGRIKRAVQSGAEVPFESGLAIERELQQQLFESADAKEGLSAYVDKRKPEFSGR